MKAKCPNSEWHTTFTTVIHVAMDVIVDDKGNFLQDAGNPDKEITHGPNSGNTWTCNVCGVEAEVSDE